MSLDTAIANLFAQPGYGLPLFLLLVVAVVWLMWEARGLPPPLLQYSLRRPWLLDPLRTVHDSFAAGQTLPPIRAVYEQLAGEFRERYGWSVTRLLGLREAFWPTAIPDRTRILRAIRHLTRGFVSAHDAEDPTQKGWYAAWRRPLRRRRARLELERALVELDPVWPGLRAPRAEGSP